MNIESFNKIQIAGKDLYQFVYDNFADEIIENYGYFPTELIDNQDKVISFFSSLTADNCWDFFCLSKYSIEYLKGTKIKPKQPTLIVYTLKELYKFGVNRNPKLYDIKDDEVKPLRNELKKYGSTGLILGYELLQLLSFKSLSMQLNKNIDSKDGLFIKYLKPTSDYPEVEAVLKNSADRISRKAIACHKRNTGNFPERYKILNIEEHVENKPENFLTSFVWEIVNKDKFFSGNLREDLQKVSKKHQNFPFFVHNKLKTEYTKNEKNKEKFKEVEELTAERQVKELSHDLEKLTVQEIITSLKEFLNNDDRNLIELSLMGFTIREIAEETGLSKSTVWDKLKKHHLSK